MNGQETNNNHFFDRGFDAQRRMVEARVKSEGKVSDQEVLGLFSALAQSYSEKNPIHESPGTNEQETGELMRSLFEKGSRPVFDENGRITGMASFGDEKNIRPMTEREVKDVLKMFKLTRKRFFSEESPESGSIDLAIAAKNRETRRKISEMIKERARELMKHLTSHEIDGAVVADPEVLEKAKKVIPEKVIVQLKRRDLIEDDTYQDVEIRTDTLPADLDVEMIEALKDISKDPKVVNKLMENKEKGEDTKINITGNLGRLNPGNIDSFGGRALGRIPTGIGISLNLESDDTLAYYLTIRSSNQSRDLSATYKLDLDNRCFVLKSVGKDAFAELQQELVATNPFRSDLQEAVVSIGNLEEMSADKLKQIVKQSLSYF